MSSPDLAKDVSTPYTQEQLVTQHQNGDAEAANILYRLVYKFLHNRIRRFHNIAAHEELFSIAHVAFMKSLKSFREDTGNKFLTYLSRLVDNEILMYRRSNLRHESNLSIETVIAKDAKGHELTLTDILPDETINFDADMMEDWEQGALLYSYQFLTPTQKQAIQLTYVQGLTQYEAAKRMGIAQSYVSRVIRKGLAIMKNQIERLDKSTDIPLPKSGSKMIINAPQKRKVESNMARKTGNINIPQLKFLFMNYEGIRPTYIAQFFRITSATMAYYTKKLRSGAYDDVKEDPSVANDFEIFCMQVPNLIQQPVRIKKITDLPASEQLRYSTQKEVEPPVPPVEEEPAVPEEPPIKDLVTVTLEEEPPYLEEEEDVQPEPTLYEEAAPALETPEESNINEQHLSFNYSGEAKIIKQLIEQYVKESLKKVDDHATIAVNFTIDVKHA